MEPFNIPPDMLAELLNEDPNPQYLSAALRGRQSLGELGMAGSPAIQDAAKPMMANAGRELGTLENQEGARRGQMLRMAMGARGKAPARMAEESQIVQLEGLNIPRALSETLRWEDAAILLRSRAGNVANASDPKVQAAEKARQEKERKTGRVLDLTIEEKTRAAAEAGKPGGNAEAVR
jgi:hypothetical protein